jgi:PEP-CTERM motif
MSLALFGVKTRSARTTPNPIRAWLTGTLLALLTASPAAAEIITWEFTGETTSVHSTTFPNLPSIFPVGTAVTFGLTYDTDWAPLYENNNGFTEWQFPGSTPPSQFNYSLTVGPHDYQWSQQGIVIVRRGPSGLNFDTSISSITLTGAPAGSSPSWYPEYLDVFFAFPLNSTELPSDFSGGLPPINFAFALSDGVNCTFQPCGNEGTVGGSLTSVRRVPTPSTLMLLGMGLAGAASLRRRGLR